MVKLGLLHYDKGMSGHTSKLGKPRLRPDTVLDKVTQTRWAADELAQVKTAAEAAQLTVSQYMRVAALGTANLDPKTRDKIFTAGNAIPN
jgi:hypothetical protein